MRSTDNQAITRIPDEPSLGMAQWLRHVARRYGQRPALTYQGRTWTYRELQAHAGRMAALLAAGGVKAGDRVGYLGLNDPAFLVALFGAARLGAIYVPLNFRLTGPELEFIVNDAGIHTLLAGAEHTAVIDGVRKTLCCQRYLGVDGAAAGWEALPALDQDSGPVPDEAEVRAADTALILYTSGTTGRPKGAMLTHGNVWSCNLNALSVLRQGQQHVALCFAPLFHVGGLNAITCQTLMTGGQVVLHRSWDPALVLKDIATYKVTHAFAVPSMMLFLSQHPDLERADLSSLQGIGVGGAPMPEPLLHLYLGRNIPVNQGYGLTETTGSLTFLDPERAVAKLGSCGDPPLMTEMRLADYEGKPITEPHVKGEVLARGGHVMKGYWNRPDATEAAFYPGGWFRTGDVGYQDEEGFLYLCDRVKDMIISGGENVYPAEVESVLYDHPAIAEVAVIGAPDAEWGERVVAVAALKPGTELTLAALQDFAGQHLARYKLPRELRLVPALPRNPTGKVMKVALRESNKAPAG